MYVQKKSHKIKKYEQSTARGHIRYIAEIEHAELGTHRLLVDSDNSLLLRKIEDQFHKWDDIWAKHWEKSQIQLEKEININEADEKTKESQEKIRVINDLLKDSIAKDSAFNWNSLINKTAFDIPNPKNQLENELSKIIAPLKPSIKQLPQEPNKSSYTPKLDIIDKIFKSSAEKKIKKADQLYSDAINHWKNEVLRTETENHNNKENYNKDIAEYQKKLKTIQQKFEELEQSWELQMDEYYLKQNDENLKIKNLEELYKIKDGVAIVEYCTIVLNKSEYPEGFPREFDLEYSKENKFLILDFVLPAPDDLPKLIEVRYIAAKKEIKEFFLPESHFLKMYDYAIYNIVLKTTNELFQADRIGAIDSIVVNGWVKSNSKATGKMTNSCIVSIQVKKDEFADIDLMNVDPKICFKNLKGLGSSKLSGITAIQPIIQVNKNDKRFVSSYDVAKSLDEGYNLAAMGWEDFEHLIRELFEKEFSTNGGEVKVTQASRDGGVDAIAYDPDPIRGGKIVIQAKRYTNTVGVSAIRDLYGTVMNEGATKGILVTTSDYGPDAYEFVKNKPLTLLSGNNLLYLLEKHGHKAKIDLAEAKKLLKDSL